MRNPIKNLYEGLIYHLRGLYDSEKQVQNSIPLCIRNATAMSLKEEIAKYAEISDLKVLKLERVFNYMLAEPGGRKCRVAEELIIDTEKIMKHTESDKVRDAMLIACIQNMVHYKIAGYGTALAFARKLDLDTAIELLEEILKWEKETDQTLTDIALQEVNDKASEGNEIENESESFLGRSSELTL